MKITVLALYVDKNKGFLLGVDKAGNHKLLGGRLEQKKTQVYDSIFEKRYESDIECLFREVSEEAPGTIIDKIQLYKPIVNGTSIQPHEIHVYRVTFKGKFRGPDRKEIIKVIYTWNPEKYKLSPATKLTFDELKKDYNF